MKRNKGELFKLLSSGFFFHKKSMLLRILLSYIVIGAILISLLSTFLAYWFSKKSMEDINRSIEQNLEISYSVVNTLWKSTFSYMYKEFSSNTMLNMLYSTTFSPEDTGEIFNQLVRITNSNNIIHSIYVWNSSADRVFTSYGPYTDSSGFFDQDILKRISSIKNKLKSKYTVMFRRIDKGYMNIQENRNLISVIFSDDNYNNSVIFNLDQSMIQSLVAPEKSGRVSRISLVSSDGTVIVDSDTSMLLSSVGAADYFNDIRSQINSSGQLQADIDGEKCLVIYKKWDILNWVFVSISDYNRLLYEIKQLQGKILWITGIFVLLSIFIAIFFIRDIYSPLYKLIKGIKAKRGKSEHAMNEYDYLKNTFESLTSDVDTFKLYKNKSRHVMKKDLLRKIISGEFLRTVELEKQITDLGLQLSNRQFLAMVLRFDDFNELCSVNSSEDLALYRFAVANIAEEFFGAEFHVETIDGEEDAVCIIINCDSFETPVYDKYYGILENIQKASREHLKISLTAGIGNAVTNFKGIHQSYKNALEAANYRLIMGKQAIVEYSETVLKRQKDYIYPMETEKNLIELIRAGDEEGVKNVTEAFFDEISGFSFDEMLLAAYQLALQVVRFVKSVLDSDEIKEYSMITDFKAIKKILDRYDTLAEINLWIADYIGILINIMKKKKEVKYEDIIAKVQKYIDENYHDPNISIDILSELVNFSPNYIRTLFKEKIGKSISNYISDLRFKKAKEYLVNTEYPAARIAEMIGFPGNGYFYTAFRKAVGTSPDEYRKINRK